MTEFRPLTETPVVGLPSSPFPEVHVAGSEEIREGEIRVTVIGSGDPWPRRSQASGSLIIEVGNSDRDFFFFDLGFESFVGSISGGGFFVFDLLLRRRLLLTAFRFLSTDFRSFLATLSVRFTC